MAETSRDAKRAQTAERIRAAARQQFGANGYEGTTIRSIAAAAGIDPSLVMQHFGSKAALFATAVQLPAASGGGSERAAADHLLDVLGIRFDTLPAETAALVRSMLTVPEAADTMRGYLDERVENLARSLDGDDARLRALMTVSGILGITITQHFLRLNAYEDASRDDLLRAARGWVESLTTGSHPTDSGAPQ
ncbi:TetR/AcrR family transcriptional regulator [Curtobacterium sp. VKM Ac-1393]|uniref:TetR/AcrR family transcriptional regulator n=1 Tax=Curtobacterium sp. VKM Ac-1393 TaxID=2783814 RepID=UPI00188A04CE|nr:TetR/AcrR family transcriptional regulator [Curtobacterium sp. VKM Ac-1393]MBF4609593.1 TetR family transcriptional regulator [Curtobacterium sp. VKM Ac-1393]